MSFCVLDNVVLENHSVQKFPLGEGVLLAAHGLLYSDNVVHFSFFQLIRRERIQISLKGGQMAFRVRADNSLTLNPGLVDSA